MKNIKTLGRIATALTWAVTCAAGATEAGGNSYPLGVETVFPGVMPPEGFHMYFYYVHYESTRNENNVGDTNQRLADYKIRSDVVASRVDWVWPGVRLLGATVDTRAALSVPTLEVKLDVARPAPLAPLDRGGSATGLADLQLAPVLLGWHADTYHQTAGLEVYLPSGTYNAARNVNTGRHYYQAAPIYALTVLPDAFQQYDLKLRYGINGKNLHTAYRSGNEFTAEFGVGYRFYPHILTGLNGYIYRQTTDDRQRGVTINGDGNRGSVNALGPFIGYSFTQKFTVLLKVQSEFKAKNRPEGTRTWLQTKVPF